MLIIKFKGVNNAKVFFENTNKNFGKAATEGTAQAGEFIVSQLKAGIGDTAYTRSLEIKTNFSKRVTYIAPDPQAIDDRGLRQRSTYQWRFFKCPYYKYVRDPSKLKNELSDYRTEQIVDSCLSEVKNIIVQNIRRIL